MNAHELGEIAAFPVPMIPCDREGGYTNVQHEGMSLRAYFAGQALAAMLSTYCNSLLADAEVQTDPEALGSFNRDLAIDMNHKTGESEGAKELAADAVLFADALLAELAKGGGA